LNTPRASGRHWVFVAAWHLLAGVALLLGLSQFLNGIAAWRASPYLLIDIALVTACYLVAAAALAAMARRSRHPVLWIVPVNVFVFGVFALALVWTHYPFSATLMAAALAGGVVLSSVPAVLARGRAVALAILLVAISAIAIRGLKRPQPPLPTAAPTTVSTALADLDLVTYRHWLPNAGVTGGAIAPLGDGFLLVDAIGRFWRISWGQSGDTLALTPLALRVPMNRDAFNRDAPPPVRRDSFRVADLIVRSSGSSTQLLVSHHYWNHDRQCWTVRLSETALPDNASVVAAWRTVFESQPCEPFSSGKKGTMFAGFQIGGAMALVDDGHVLLALGDHELDGVNAERSVSQDPAVDYGKTLLIDLDTGHAEHYTVGHRNPQGVVIASNGEIWATEHGPQGGDELNHIDRGGNYGWPLVTLGTDYGGVPWPGSRTPGEHTGFVLPIYSWVPSMGVSAVIQPTAATVPAWQGDLLVASLDGQTLWRCRIREHRAVYAEPIHIGMRIRDLAESPKGRIVLWNDAGVLVSIQMSHQADRGAQLFAQCAGCHAFGEGPAQRSGPDLGTVFHRQIGSLPGYNFSPALLRVGGRWSDHLLSEFLRDPQAFAPGTTMLFKGMPSSDDREALIAYLKKLSERPSQGR
jgi:cytochrome c2